MPGLPLCIQAWNEGMLTSISLGMQGPTNEAVSLHATGAMTTQGPPVCQAHLHSQLLEAVAQVLVQQVLAGRLLST